MKFLNAMRLMMHDGNMYDHFVSRWWQILLIIFDYDPDDLCHRIINAVLSKLLPSALANNRAWFFFTGARGD